MDVTSILQKGLQMSGYGPEVRAILTEKITQGVQKVNALDREVREMRVLLEQIHAKVHNDNAQGA